MRQGNANGGCLLLKLFQLVEGDDNWVKRSARHVWKDAHNVYFTPQVFPCDVFQPEHQERYVLQQNQMWRKFVPNGIYTFFEQEINQ